MTADYEAEWKAVETLPWCALVTTGRTGSDFFQSLFDGHPEAIVFNGQQNFHQFWQNARSAGAGALPAPEDIIDEFIGAYIHRFKSRYDLVERKNELGEQRNECIQLDPQVFRQHALGLLGNRPATSRNVCLAVNAGFALTLGQRLTGKSVFFHHVHRIGGLDMFLEDFPEAKVICMIREFGANYVSGVENWRRFNAETDSPAYPIYILWRAVDEARPLRRLPPDRIRALRLEDLGNTDVLKRICRWLGVDYDPCLTKSTWNGLRWWGDKISRSPPPAHQPGFSASMVQNNWRDRIGRTERFVLDGILGPYLGHYGYPREHHHGAIGLCLLIFAVLAPTRYERRFLNPIFMVSKFLRGRPKAAASGPYHYLRRVSLHYKLLVRLKTRDHVLLPRFSESEPSNRH